MELALLRIATAAKFLVVLVPSVVLHEVAHGVVALHYGDDTAKRAGRLTLNPLPHIDPFGSVILPAILAMVGAPPFGYARPVPVNQGRLRDPRNHGLLVSLAGPATNIVIAVLVALVLRSLTGMVEGGLRLSPDSLWLELLLLFGVLNVVLAAFNLLPLPPLDGSEVVARFLPRRWLPAWFKLRRWSMPLLFLVIFLVPGALSRVFDAALSVWALLL